MSLTSLGGLPAAGLNVLTGRRNSLIFGLSLLGLALLYFLTIPGNHTEAEDCLWYAYDVREKPYPALFHPHHLFYLPLMRLIYTVGHFPDAYGLMIGFDILCAVATVGIVFVWLNRGMGLDWRASLFACLFLALSYGFWRYAVEAEVYLPALVLQAILASRVFRPARTSTKPDSWFDHVVTAAAGAACMLMHAPLSVSLAVAAVPVYMLLTRRFRALIIYGAVATFLVTSAYYWAYRTQVNAHDPSVGSAASFTKFLAEGGDNDPLLIEWTDFPKAVTGLGASVVSSNYLFAIPKTHDKLFGAFPTRNFTEEDFMAKSYSRSLAYVGLIFTILLLGIIGFTLARRLAWNASRVKPFFASPENQGVLLWLVGYCALVFVIEPENPENWVCSLLPIAAAAGICLHFLYRNIEKAVLPWIFIAGLIAQNLTGGFFMIHSAKSDFNVAKGAWIVEHARAGDVVFIRSNEVFSRYVRYHSRAQVVECFKLDSAAVRRKIEQTPAAPGGTRYLYTEVIEPPRYMCLRMPGLCEELANLRQELTPILLPTEAEDVKRLP